MICRRCWCLGASRPSSVGVDLGDVLQAILYCFQFSPWRRFVFCFSGEALAVKLGEKGRRLVWGFVYPPVSLWSSPRLLSKRRTETRAKVFGWVEASWSWSVVWPIHSLAPNRQNPYVLFCRLLLGCRFIPSFALLWPDFLLVFVLIVLFILLLAHFSSVMVVTNSSSGSELKLVLILANMTTAKVL